jgi:hypothetical protein
MVNPGVPLDRKLPLTVTPEDPIVFMLKNNISSIGLADDPADVRFCFSGKNLRIDAIVGRKIFARLFLNGEGFASVRVGDPNSFCIPADYLAGDTDLRFFCKATANEGILNSVSMIEYKGIL